MGISWQIGRTAPGLTSSNFAGTEALIGRELASYDELLAANELYARVFGYEDPGFTLNPNLLCALAGNGGSVVGVFADEKELVGFAYGFAGRDSSGHEYHYSQSAVVSSDYQGKGIGRELKRLQRSVAQRSGCERMRWTFDPILTRNGHFNFSSLGAIGIEFHDNYYCRPETDRVVVEWALDSEVDRYLSARNSPAPTLPTTSWGSPVEHGQNIWIPLPATPEQALHLNLRPQLAEAMRAVFDKDLVLIDCRRLDTESAAYLAVPRIGNAAEHAAPGFHPEEI